MCTDAWCSPTPSAETSSCYTAAVWERLLINTAEQQAEGCTCAGWWPPTLAALLPPPHCRLFKKDPTPREAARASQRDVHRNVRDVDREIQTLRREEQKLIKVCRLWRHL